MLEIRTARDTLLHPLQSVSGIVEKKHTLPILSNVLIESGAAGLSFVASDLEIQITSRACVEHASEGAMTVSAKKLQDILRALPDGADVLLEEKDSRVSLRAGKSRFNLQSLPAADFPRLAPGAQPACGWQMPQKALRSLLYRVQFAMAVQDIRYYLNGLLFAVEGSTLRLVATDGHRLSYGTCPLDAEQAKQDVILPRKTVTELTRLLADTDDPVAIEIRQNQIRFQFSGLELVSKVVDGKFPDYSRVIPTHYAKQVIVDRVALLQALNRVAILSNDKIRGVRLVFNADSLSILCTNTEQEEAEEEMSVDYPFEVLDIGFNVSYLLDVLNHVDEEKVVFSLGDAKSGVLVTLPGNEAFKYVVMPMRI